MTCIKDLEKLSLEDRDLRVNTRTIDLDHRPGRRDKIMNLTQATIINSIKKSKGPFEMSRLPVQVRDDLQELISTGKIKTRKVIKPSLVDPTRHITYTYLSVEA